MANSNAAGINRHVAALDIARNRRVVRSGHRHAGRAIDCASHVDRAVGHRDRIACDIAINLLRATGVSSQHHGRVALDRAALVNSNAAGINRHGLALDIAQNCRVAISGHRHAGHAVDCARYRNVAIADRHGVACDSAGGRHQVRRCCIHRHITLGVHRPGSCNRITRHRGCACCRQRAGKVHIAPRRDHHIRS